jgi:hypothetical protein
MIMEVSGILRSRKDPLAPTVYMTKKNVARSSFQVQKSYNFLQLKTRLCVCSLSGAILSMEDKRRSMSL